MTSFLPLVHMNVLCGTENRSSKFSKLRFGKSSHLFSEALRSSFNPALICDETSSLSLTKIMRLVVFESFPSFGP